MGKSGMKRKGRKHLPKAGTRPSTEQVMRHEHDHAMHPFSSDPSHTQSGPAYWIVAAALLALVFFAVVGLIILN